MKSKLIRALAFLSVPSVLVLSACGGEPSRAQSQLSPECPIEFPQSSLCAEIAWNEAPRARQLLDFALRFWDRQSGSPDGPYAVPEDVSVDLWMPHMNHGSSPVSVSLAEDGTFRCGNVYFSMAGLWQIRIQLKKNGATFERSTVELSL